MGYCTVVHGVTKRNFTDVDRVNKRNFTDVDRVNKRNFIGQIPYYDGRSEKHKVSLKGSSDALYKPHKGNFLDFIELLARFHPIMKQYLDRCVKSASRSYLSRRIQGELISALYKKS
ncbi:hypothetical protein AVEN_267299-1 [Araneus ventricosus]|uniref:Uncharacterized protein n=1 Tax=Araneus ventricosus TaxID=182803 RepID=A0A4Y2DJG1_ARAVE|nr:hypothetical protein AVEN_267299-1 [Araneus ventricosus]